MYLLRILPQAQEDIKFYKSSGNKNAIEKIEILLKELQAHPKEGTGHPEQLKYELKGYWSRKIDKKNRLIYRIEEEIVTVVVISALGHY